MALARAAALAAKEGMLDGLRGPCTSLLGRMHGPPAAVPGAPSASRQAAYSSTPPQQPQQPQQPQAAPLSKAFVVANLSQDELWLTGVGGRIKIWAARQHPELKVRRGCPAAPCLPRSSLATPLRGAQARTYPSPPSPPRVKRPQGQEDAIVARVRGAYLELLTRHATGRLLSTQARAQLKLACLAVASFR
jgi:hypothetical protein